MFMWITYYRIQQIVRLDKNFTKNGKEYVWTHWQDKK